MKFTFIRKFAVLAALAAVFAIQSCSDDPEPLAPGQAGFYIVNEGAWRNNNTSISYYDRSSNTVTNDVFAIKNSRPLGDQSQSMTVIGDKGYIVVQNSKKIEVINANDFSSVTTITENIVSPRYLIAVSSTKAYISDWGTGGATGTIKVLDLSTNTIVKTIEAVGAGTNRMIKVGNLVYVANSGAWGVTENTVKVIDIATDAITDTIETGENPNSLQVDKDGNLWVAASGEVAYNGDNSINIEGSIKGSISKITAGEEVFRKYVDDVTYSGVTSLSISVDGTQLYYLFNDAIYTMTTSAETLPVNMFKSPDHYYGLAIDPFDGSIIACKAPNFSSAGSIQIINPATGSVEKSFTTGIAPNGCAFK